jgi:hypothetical protein
MMKYLRYCGFVMFLCGMGWGCSTWFPPLSAVSQEVQMAKSRVLVGSIVRQDPEIIREFLRSVSLLSWESCTLDFMFIDANENVESCDILAQFARQYGKRCFVVDGTHEAQKKGLWIWKNALLKDQMLEHARQQEYDYVVLLDSDVVLPPNTIDHLISTKKEIVSNIVWTSQESNENQVPQVWLSDLNNQFEIAIREKLSEEEQKKRRKVFFDQLHEPGIYEVGGVSACTLIRKSALTKGVNFHRLKNLTFQGDDCHFSLRAVAMDIPLFVDTCYPAYRIVKKSV